MARKRTYSIIKGTDRVCNETGEVVASKIGGEWFDYSKPSTHPVYTNDCNNMNEIYNVYGRPSDTKVAIWQDWVRWAEKNNAQLAIGGHSCMFFSIYGIIQIDGELYNLYITYANQRISHVEEEF